MGRDLVRVAGDIRRSVHDYETSYAYDTCWGLMYGLSDWLKIRQKQLKARQSRQNQVYLAFSSQKQVRCEVGQSQGSWRVIYTWLYTVPLFGTKMTWFTFFGKKTFVFVLLLVLEHLNV